MLTLQLPFTQLIGLNGIATRVFHAGTLWVPTEEVDLVRGQFDQMAGTTSFRAVLAYQVANIAHVPIAVGGLLGTDIGTALTADAMNYTAKVSLASALASYRFVRFGWNVWYDSGGAAPVYGRCGGSVDVWPPPT